MDKNIQDLITKMRGTPEGQAIRVYVEEKIHELSFLKGITGTIEEKGRIVEARQEAIKILQNIFNVLEIKKSENNKIKYN